MTMGTPVYTVKNIHLVRVLSLRVLRVIKEQQAVLLCTESAY